MFQKSAFANSLWYWLIHTVMRLAEVWRFSVDFSLTMTPNPFLSSLSQQVKRSQPPIPALPVSSRMAALGSCCSMLRTPMASVSTWKVNMAALSHHAWVDLPPWVEVQTALLSLPFMASICLLTQAPSTSSASLARAQVDGIASEQGVESVLQAQLVGVIISVSLPHHPCSAPLQGTTWTPITWAQRSWRWQPTTRVPLTGCCASILLCPWTPLQQWTSHGGYGSWRATPQGPPPHYPPAGQAPCNACSSHSRQEEEVEEQEGQGAVNLHILLPHLLFQAPCSHLWALRPLLLPLSPQQGQHPPPPPPWNQSVVSFVVKPSSFRVI